MLKTVNNIVEMLQQSCNVRSKRNVCNILITLLNNTAIIFFYARTFRPLAVYHIFHNTDTYSLFSLYKRGGIQNKAIKKKKKILKKSWKTFLEKKF